jgi:hypothetical protein
VAALRLTDADAQQRELPLERSCKSMVCARQGARHGLLPVPVHGVISQRSTGFVAPAGIAHTPFELKS